MESCRFFTMCLCRIRSRAISLCQSIVWKSSYCPIPGMSSASPATINKLHIATQKCIHIYVHIVNNTLYCQFIYVYMFLSKKIKYFICVIIVIVIIISPLYNKFKKYIFIQPKIFMSCTNKYLKKKTILTQITVQ